MDMELLSNICALLTLTILATGSLGDVAGQWMAARRRRRERLEPLPRPTSREAGMLA
jgi:hypothetical protein